MCVVVVVVVPHTILYDENQMWLRKQRQREFVLWAGALVVGLSTWSLSRLRHQLYHNYRIQLNAAGPNGGESHDPPPHPSSSPPHRHHDYHHGEHNHHQQKDGFGTTDDAGFMVDSPRGIFVSRRSSTDEAEAGQSDEDGIKRIGSGNGDGGSSSSSAATTWVSPPESTVLMKLIAIIRAVVFVMWMTNMIATEISELYLENHTVFSFILTRVAKLLIRYEKFKFARPLLVVSLWWNGMWTEDTSVLMGKVASIRDPNGSNGNSISSVLAGGNYASGSSITSSPLWLAVADPIAVNLRQLAILAAKMGDQHLFAKYMKRLSERNFSLKKHRWLERGPLAKLKELIKPSAAAAASRVKDAAKEFIGFGRIDA